MSYVGWLAKVSPDLILFRWEERSCERKQSLMHLNFNSSKTEFANSVLFLKGAESAEMWTLQQRTIFPGVLEFWRFCDGLLK